MALEHSYNKYAKSNLFHGISNKPSTMSKYVYAMPNLTAISEQILDMVIMNDNAGSSSVTCTAEVDMEIHRKVYDMIKEKMIDPFRYQEGDLTNISNKDVAQSLDLIEAKRKGLAALEETEKSGGQKVKPILLSTFVQKGTRKTSATEKSAALYKEEREVIHDLCFAKN